MRIEKPEQKVLETLEVKESFRVKTKDGNYILDEGDTLQIVEANGLELTEDVQVPTDSKEVTILEAGDFINVVEQKVEEATLDSIMKKVGAGKDLSDEDEKVLSAALDASKEEDKDEMNKLMKKVRAGKELTDTEEKMLGAYIDASKKKDEAADMDDEEDEMDEADEAGDTIENPDGKKGAKPKMAGTKESVRSRRRRMKESHISGAIQDEVVTSLIEAMVDRGGMYAASELQSVFSELISEYYDMMGSYDSLYEFFDSLEDEVQRTRQKVSKMV